MAILHDYYRPSTIAEAVQLLQRQEVRLLPLAGGTHLIGALETNRRRDVDGVVDLCALGLSYIRAHTDALHIGATTTLRSLSDDPMAGTLAGAILRRTAQYEGAANLRNAATIGGIVAGAAVDSELYAALLALNATVVSHNGVAESQTPLADFAGRQGQQPFLITEIRIPTAGGHSGHARIARTPMDRPIVAAVAVHGTDGMRMALCGVAERPVLDGQPLSPPSDYKGSADYRLAMIDVVKRRALENARQGIDGGHV